MWYDENIKSYADIAYFINKKYCEKYGYDIIKDCRRRIPYRKPHYERLPLIEKHLPHYDYVIWIDADAHFYIDSPPIYDLIKKYDNRDFIFSGDHDKNTFETITNTANDKINSGIFIVKNSQYSFKIIKEWAYNNYLFENRVNSRVWNDQGIVRLLYEKNLYNFQDHSAVIPYGVLQHFALEKKNNRHLDTLSYQILLNSKMEKPFIRHMPGHGKETRIKLFKEYIIKNLKQFKN